MEEDLDGEVGGLDPFKMRCDWNCVNLVLDGSSVKNNTCTMIVVQKLVNVDLGECYLSESIGVEPLGDDPLRTSVVKCLLH